MRVADIVACSAAGFGPNASEILELRTMSKGFRVDVYPFTHRHELTSLTATAYSGGRK